MAPSLCDQEAVGGYQLGLAEPRSVPQIDQLFGEPGSAHVALGERSGFIGGSVCIHKVALPNLARTDGMLGTMAAARFDRWSEGLAHAPQDSGPSLIRETQLGYRAARKDATPSPAMTTTRSRVQGSSLAAKRLALSPIAELSPARGLENCHSSDTQWLSGLRRSLLRGNRQVRREGGQAMPVRVVREST
jgi:hypothetical protein